MPVLPRTFPAVTVCLFSVATLFGCTTEPEKVHDSQEFIAGVWQRPVPKNQGIEQVTWGADNTMSYQYLAPDGRVTSVVEGTYATDSTTVTLDASTHFTLDLPFEFDGRMMFFKDFSYYANEDTFVMSAFLPDLTRTTSTTREYQAYQGGSTAELTLWSGSSESSFWLTWTPSDEYLPCNGDWDEMATDFEMDCTEATGKFQWADNVPYLTSIDATWSTTPVNLSLGFHRVK